jgi:fructokinase
MQATPNSSPRCAVLGEALVDLFPDGPVIGGAPFNVARNLAALGEPPLTVTRLGSDALADDILAQFTHFGLAAGAVQRDPQRATGTVRVVLGDGGHRFEIGADQAWDAIDATRAVEAVRQCRPEIVCFGTLAQRSAASRHAIRLALQATPALRVLDLNLRDGCDEALVHDSLALANVAKLNDDELERVLQWFVYRGARRDAAWGSADHAAALAELMAQFGLQRLIVTRGALGYAAFDAQGACLAHGPVPAVSVEDTVGAGDAFLAVSLLGPLRGWPLATTLRRAGEFAAAVCTLRGAVTQDLGFYGAWRARWQHEAESPG